MSDDYGVEEPINYDAAVPALRVAAEKSMRRLEAENEELRQQLRQSYDVAGDPGEALRFYAGQVEKLRATMREVAEELRSQAAFEPISTGWATALADRLSPPLVVEEEKAP